MIDGLYSAAANMHTARGNDSLDQGRKVLRMAEASRMGGSMPVWETPKNASSSIEDNLSYAQNTGGYAADNVDGTLSYSASAADARAQAAQQQEFSFSDLLDMVNPLHHLPVVGHLYRELTGDQIKPIGQIIGGAVFGGPVGVATSLANVIVTEETGRDVAGNAMAMMFKGEAPRFKSDTPSDQPEERLNQVASSMQGRIAPPKTPAGDDMPGALLAFADLKADASPQRKIVIERRHASENRTAGSVSRLSYPVIEQAALPPREPITQVRFSRYNG